MIDRNPYHLHHSIGYQLSRTARLQERGFEAKLRNLGLSRTTWCILLAVQNEDLHNPSAIADYIGIDRTATSRALRKMAQEGLVVQDEETSDGRRKNIYATPKATHLLVKATGYARENAAYFEAKLTNSEQNSLRNLLLKLQSGEGEPLAHL